MAIDWQAIADAGGIPKGPPRAIAKKAKDRAEDRASDACDAAVDLRDKCVCQISGAWLKAGQVDGWQALERAHLEARSQSKKRRYVPENVLTMARSVHQVFDASGFYLFDKGGSEALRVQDIDHFAWNRRMIARGAEPFRVKQGLAVVELDEVRD